MSTLLPTDPLQQLADLAAFHTVSEMTPPPTTPASSGPTSSSTSLNNPTPELCITPPSQRRREARLARCAYIVGARRAANGDPTAAAVEAEAEPSTGYAAEEVEARRMARTPDWGGWEAEAEGYTGERFVGHLAAARGLPVGDGGGADETWEDAAPEQWELALGLGAEAQAWARRAGGVEAPVAVPTQGGLGMAEQWVERMGVPTLGMTGVAGVGSGLPSQTLPLLLGSLYLFARAMGVGDSGGRRERGGEAQGKVREMGRRM